MKVSLLISSLLCRYELCSRILEDRFPSLAMTNLGLTALLVSTANNLEDLTNLIKRLLHNVTPSTEVKIIETFFLMLTKFSLFRDEFKMPWRASYLLYHALTLQLSNFSAKSNELTAEQRRIINMDLSSLTSRDAVRIMAYAGTGKTTTLKRLTEKHPDTKFLLVVFNKSVEVHSKKEFPGNVLVKTAHSLSYKYITEKHDQSSFQHFNVKYSDLLSNYLLPRRAEKEPYKPFNLYQWAAMVMDTITRFCNSADTSLTLDHVPEYWIVHPERKNVEVFHKVKILEDSKEVWRKIRDPNVRTAKYDHTTSMKEFQLSAPDLQEYAGQYDVLLLDEAQDMNPCMLDICLEQNVPKIVVGDNFQQIYGFRGAVNALEIIKKHRNTSVKETFYLSQSFRFGAEIAFAVESCLKHLLGAPGPSIVGTTKKDSVGGQIDSNPPDSTGITEKVAIIGRTNFGLFCEMVRLVSEVEEHARPRIAIGVGDDPLGWRKLKTLFNKMVSDSGSWGKQVREARDSNDVEMLGKIRIVEKYKEKIPQIVKTLQDQRSKAEKGGEEVDDPEVKFVFSTVHKFKGLEMDNVRLLDDFIYQGLPYNVPANNHEQKEEFNLLYVALTRAKTRLMMNDALYFLMTSTTVDSCYEELRAPPLVTTQCVLCSEQTAQYQSPAVLWQQPLSILHSIQRSPGYLCSVCAWANQRRVCHVVGGRRKNDPLKWNVPAGIVSAGNHAFLRRVLSPRDVNQEDMASLYYNRVLAARPRDIQGCELAHLSEYTTTSVVNSIFLQPFGDVL